MSNKEITIDNPSLETRYKYTRCLKCIEYIKWGEEIHTHTTKGGQHKVHHKKCWDSNFY